MRIAIDHRTRYRFSQPQGRIVQLLRMTPQDGVDQTVVNWHIGVDCDARLMETRDGFGNRVTMLYANGPVEHLEIAVTGEVLTADGNGVVGGAWEPLPPILFLRASERAQADVEITAFAASAAVGSEIVERLHALNLALHARFEDRAEHHDLGRTAAQVFAAREASARDMAHVFIAAARSLGVPARYISGYRPDGDSLPAPHAWVEAHVEALGWATFDPFRGRSTDETYVRVAVGLDAGTAAPVAGTRLGEGKEVLDVDLHVAAVGSAR